MQEHLTELLRVLCPNCREVSYIAEEVYYGLALFSCKYCGETYKDNFAQYYLELFAGGS